MQTLCPSIRWNHISLAGFLERRNNIFLCCGIALVVYSGLGIYSSGRGNVQGDTCGRHAGCAGVEVECEGCWATEWGHEGLAPLLFMRLPQSAAPALTISTPTDPCLAVSQLWCYIRRWWICLCVYTVTECQWNLFLDLNSPLYIHFYANFYSKLSWSAQPQPSEPFSPCLHTLRRQKGCEKNLQHN